MIKANWVWKLPAFASNKLAHDVVGGWQWAGIFTILSGEPIYVGLTTSDTFPTDGVVDSSPRPNQTGKPQDGKAIHDWLNSSAFSVPAFGVFGNAGISPARLPRQTQLDSSVAKDFPLHDRLQMQFKLEAINAFNHSLFNGVNGTFPNAYFGTITSTGTPRIVQAGLHFSF